MHAHTPLDNWYTVLPERATARNGGTALATVVMESADAQTCELQVPVCVGRILDRKHDEVDARVERASDLRHIVDDLCERQAWQRVLDLVGRCDYSREGLKTKLYRYGFARGVVEKTLERAVTSSLVNDERYAEVFVRSKLYAGWGLMRIERELSRRGVDVHALQGWPYDYADPDEELARALEIAARKRVSEPHAFEKLVRYLAGRGYSFSVAKEAASQTLGRI